MKPGPGEKYTIRRKVLKLFGGAFHIYGAQGELVGYCAQKAFKLREDLRIYTDESKSKELMRIGAKQVIDFSGSYAVSMPDGSALGTLRRRGGKSTFLRDEWTILSAAGQEIGKIQEDSTFKAMVRRYIEYAAPFLPQKYTVADEHGAHVATFRVHFNPFVYRLGVAIVKEDEQIDELLLLAAGCLVSAIEGRQA